MQLKSHSKNFLYLFSGDIAGRLLGFAATTYLARVLGASGFGVISIGMAVLAYAMILGNSGLTLSGTRKLAAEPDTPPEFLGRVLTTRLGLTMIVFVLAAAVIYFSAPASQTAAVTIVYLLYLFPSALWLDWYFQARRQMGLISSGKFVGMLFYLVFILVFVQTEDNVLNVAWGWTIGGTATAVFLGIVFQWQKHAVRFSLKNLKPYSLLKEAFPLGIANLSSQFAIQFPVLYLGWFATTSDVGIFSVAFRLTVMLLIFDRIFYTMFFPEISRHASQLPEMLETTFNRVLKIITVSALILSLLTILSAEFIITFLFGAQYSASVPIFRILTGYFVLTLIISVFGYTLIGMGHEKAFTRSILIGTATFFIALFILVHFFSIIGVSSALIVYELATLTAMIAALRKYLSFSLLRRLLAPFGGTFLLCLPILTWLNFMLPLKLLLALIIGAPLIAWMSGINKDDIQYFRKIFI